MPEKMAGYRCPMSGECYAPNDSRLFGYGSPPSSPAMQSAFKGGGRFEMYRTMLDASEVPEDQLVRARAAGMVIEVPEPVAPEPVEPTPDAPTPQTEEENNA